MNVNVVCPHCFKVNRIPKKESYTKANCGGCKNSLLKSSTVADVRILYLRVHLSL
jgi:thioredoxin 2